MEKSLERCMGRDPPHRKESHLYEYSNIYMVTKYGWRAVYYLRKSRVYFFRLPDGTPIQVYPIW